MAVARRKTMARVQYRIMKKNPGGIRVQARSQGRGHGANIVVE